MDENLFGLFGIKNDSTILQNVAIYLFTCFVSQVTVIPWNDTFLYYKKNQKSNFLKNMCYMILRNTFLALEKV